MWRGLYFKACGNVPIEDQEELVLKIRPAFLLRILVSVLSSPVLGLCSRWAVPVFIAVLVSALIVVQDIIIIRILFTGVHIFIHILGKYRRSQYCAYIGIVGHGFFLRDSEINFLKGGRL